MKFKLEFEMDNDAFQDGNQWDEIGGLLIYLITQVIKNKGTHENQGNVTDTNGNKIGQWAIREGE